MANADYCLARAFAVKPSRHQERRDPRGRWGLTAQRGRAEGAYMPLNAKMRPSRSQLYRAPRLGARERP
jgi:hypothetical protein